MKINWKKLMKRTAELEGGKAQVNIAQINDVCSAFCEALTAAWDFGDTAISDVGALIDGVADMAAKRRAREAMAAKRDTIIKMHLLTPPEKIKAKRRK